MYINMYVPFYTSELDEDDAIGEVAQQGVVYVCLT